MRENTIVTFRNPSDFQEDPLTDFCYGTRRSAFRGVDRYVYERARNFLARRHKVAGRGTRKFSCDVVYGEHGLLRLERLP